MNKKLIQIRKIAKMKWKILKWCIWWRKSITNNKMIVMFIMVFVENKVVSYYDYDWVQFMPASDNDN